MNEQLEAAIAELSHSVASNGGLILAFDEIKRVLRRHFSEPPAAYAVEAEREACAKMRETLLEIRKIVENGDRWSKEGNAANIHIIVVDALQTSGSIRACSSPAVVSETVKAKITTKSLGDVIRAKLAADPELAKAVDIERRSMIIQDEVYDALAADARSKAALLADLEALGRKLRSGVNPGRLLYAADDLDRVITKHTKGASDERLR